MKNGLLTFFKDAVLPASIYLYFTGFIYVYYLYYHLGVNVSSTDIPVYYFFIYAFDVFRPHLWVDGFVLVSLLVLDVSFRTASWFRNIMMIGALLVLIPILYGLASTTAQADALAIRKGKYLNPIKFSFMENQSYSPELVSANKSDRLRLLLETKDRYYVLDQLCDDTDPVLAQGFAYSIAKAGVSDAKVTLKQLRLDSQ